MNEFLLHHGHNHVVTQKTYSVQRWNKKSDEAFSQHRESTLVLYQVAAAPFLYEICSDTCSPSNEAFGITERIQGRSPIRPPSAFVTGCKTRNAHTLPEKERIVRENWRHKLRHDFNMCKDKENATTVMQI